jgi:TonB family protein
MEPLKAFRFLLAAIGCFLLLATATLINVHAQTDQPQIVRKSGGVLAGSATKRVEPTYPPLAKAARISGVVVVEVTVDTDGKVIAARAISGHPLLKDAAVEAARQWVFQPTTLSGQAVKVIGTITFNFDFPDDPKYVEALKQAEEKVHLNPDSAEVNYDLGMVYFSLARWEEAIEPFKKAISLKPDYEDAYLGLGGVYNQLNRLDEEIVTYRQGLEKLPDSDDILLRLSDRLMQVKRYTERIAILKKLIDLKPKDKWNYYFLALSYYKLNNDNEAISTLLQIITLDPGYVLAYPLMGSIYNRQGRYADAIAAYKQALKLDSNNQITGETYIDLGEVYFKVNQFAEAIEALKEGIKLTSSRIDAYCHLGDAYAMIGRYDEALDAYKQGLEHYPGDSIFQNRISTLYLKLGRGEEAEKFLRDETKKSPQAPGAYFDLAKLLYDKQNIEEANGLIKNAVGLYPQNVDIRIAAARIYAAYGRKAESEAEYRAALRLAPNNALVLNNLGYDLLERNEKLTEALQLIQKAVELEPNSGYYLDSLGWAYFKLGKLEDAERSLKQAAEILPDAADIFDHLGEVYQKQGKTELAKNSWRKALSLSASAEDRARLKAKIESQPEKKK